MASSAQQFLVEDDFEPAYLRLHRTGELERRAAAALEQLTECRSCPRQCGVNRLQGETGVCQTGRHAIVSSAYPHMGEEDCIRGDEGSGAVFFGWCNLQCVFCHNWDSSQQRLGWEADAPELAATMLDLQERGCPNINLVTPEHVAPQVAEALALAAKQGLRLPLVCNANGYDGPRSLRLLDGLVDIYLVDFKFWNPASAERLAHAEDYPEQARRAIREMFRQVGVLRMARDGVARRGVLLRHLVLPSAVDEAICIMRWVARELSTDSYVHVMSQYAPAHRVSHDPGKCEQALREIARLPSAEELAEVHAAARQAGLWRLHKR